MNRISFLNGGYAFKGLLAVFLAPGTNIFFLGGGVGGRRGTELIMGPSLVCIPKRYCLHVHEAFSYSLS